MFGNLSGWGNPYYGSGYGGNYGYGSGSNPFQNYYQQWPLWTPPQWPRWAPQQGAAPPAMMQQQQVPPQQVPPQPPQMPQMPQMPQPQLQPQTQWQLPGAQPDIGLYQQPQGAFGDPNAQTAPSAIQAPAQGIAQPGGLGLPIDPIALMVSGMRRQL